MMEVEFNPFPVLETGRLLLRQLSVDDAPAVFALRSDPRVLEHIGREPATEIGQAISFIERILEAGKKNESIMWGITLREQPELVIGSICFWQLQPENFRAELGYVLHPDHWNKGIMKEAIGRVMQYGFEIMGLHSIEARTNATNIPSGKVLLASGFIQEGYLREELFHTGKFHDSVIYGCLRSNWK